MVGWWAFFGNMIVWFVLGDVGLELLFGVCWVLGCVYDMMYAECLSPSLDSWVGTCDFWSGLPPSALIRLYIRLGLWCIYTNWVWGLGHLD